MSNTWNAVIVDAPDVESNKEYPTDPQDWRIELWLEDAVNKTYEEVIYVVFTGTVDDDGNVTATPEEQVDNRIEAMLKGLNKSLKRKP